MLNSVALNGPGGITADGMTFVLMSERGSTKATQARVLVATRDSSEADWTLVSLEDLDAINSTVRNQ